MVGILVPGNNHFILRLRRALQQRSSEQRHRLHHAKGHARRASGGDSGRRRLEIAGGAGTAEESPSVARVTESRITTDDPSRMLAVVDCD